MNRRNFIKSTITAIALTASGLRLASAGLTIPEHDPYGFSDGDFWAEDGELRIKQAGQWIVYEHSERYRVAPDHGLIMTSSVIADVHRAFPERRITLTAIESIKP